MFFRGKIRGRRLFRRRPPEEISSCGGKSAFCVIGRFSLEKCSIMQVQGKKEKRSRKFFGAAPFAFRRDLFCFVKKPPIPKHGGPAGRPAGSLLCLLPPSGALCARRRPSCLCADLLRRRAPFAFFCRRPLLRPARAVCGGKGIFRTVRDGSKTVQDGLVVIFFCNFILKNETLTVTNARNKSRRAFF